MTKYLGCRNDVWKFNTVSRMWAWVGGNNTEGADSIFPMAPGELGVPGCRRGPVSKEINGNWYIFGGFKASGKLFSKSE